MSTFTTYTEEELQRELADLKAAYRAAATGKSYTIDGQTVTRQDMAVLRKQMDIVEARLADFARRPATVFVKPRFVR